MNAELYRAIFRNPGRVLLFPSYLAVFAWRVACAYTTTPEFAARLEADLRAAPRRTVAQSRARWEGWQREQGR